MHRVFVDTAAWIALINKDDRLWSQAQQVQRTLRQQNVRMVTTEFVLLEVADGLCTPPQRNQTLGFINGLRRLPLLRIVPAHQDLIEEGWVLYGRRLDKAWSLTDCISFVVMQQEQITQAFTSDQHFDQAGFTRLPSPS